jgi:putative membrane protein
MKHRSRGFRQMNIQRTNNIVIALLLVGVLLASLSGCYGGYGMGPGMMGPGGYSNGYGVWGMVMGIAMLLFWALVIGGIVLLVVWAVRQARSAAPAAGGNRALDILQERYARGEIAREQYEQIRHDLQAGKP